MSSSRSVPAEVPGIQAPAHQAGQGELGGSGDRLGGFDSLGTIHEFCKRRKHLNVLFLSLKWRIFILNSPNMPKD